MDWHIALTQPGQDRVACDALRSQRYLVYRPIMFGSVRHGRGRMRSVIKSMFPGYLFVIDEFSRGWEWLRISHGVRFKNSLLMMHGHLATVDSDVMTEIKAEEQRQCTRTINGEKIVVPYKVGDTVRIEEGPFSGLFGEVEKLDDLERICLLLKILGRQSRVYLSHTHLASI